VDYVHDFVHALLFRFNHERRGVGHFNFRPFNEPPVFHLGFGIPNQHRVRSGIDPFNHFRFNEIIPAFFNRFNFFPYPGRLSTNCNVYFGKSQSIGTAGATTPNGIFKASNMAAFLFSVRNVSWSPPILANPVSLPFSGSLPLVALFPVFRVFVDFWPLGRPRVALFGCFFAMVAYIVLQWPKMLKTHSCFPKVWFIKGVFVFLPLFFIRRE
jgi:hypothetical protein